MSNTQSNQRKDGYKKEKHLNNNEKSYELVYTWLSFGSADIPDPGLLIESVSKESSTLSSRKLSEFVAKVAWEEPDITAVFRRPSLPSVFTIRLV